jgi:hypothetical protein
MGIAEPQRTFATPVRSACVIAPQRRPRQGVPPVRPASSTGRAHDRARTVLTGRAPINSLAERDRIQLGVGSLLFIEIGSEEADNAVVA